MHTFSLSGRPLPLMCDSFTRSGAISSTLTVVKSAMPSGM
jgi:hypothetical protein